jgi:hypothetical protein
MYEHLIKRTIWKAKCTCGIFEDVKTDSPPRERQCKCGKEWCKYEEQSAVGPDLLLENR